MVQQKKYVSKHAKKKESIGDKVSGAFSGLKERAATKSEKKSAKAPKEKMTKELEQKVEAEGQKVKHRGRSNSLGYFVLPLTVIYLEMILRIVNEHDMGFLHIVGTVLFSIAIGAFFNIFCAIPRRSNKASKIICGVLAELLTVGYLVMHFLNQYFTVYMSPSDIAEGAENVVGEFSGDIVKMVVGSWKMVLCFHIPVFIFLVLVIIFNEKNGTKRGLRFDKLPGLKGIKSILVLLIITLVFGVFASVLQIIPKIDRAKCTVEYNYDNAVRTFGVGSALRLDIGRMIFGAEGGEIIDDPGTDPEPEPVVIERNVLDIDFEALANATSDKTLKSLYNSLANQVGTNKNDFTGYFEGKNLIFITAEAFSKEAVHPELTPNLYRLVNNGINFTNYYQPAWGGSTSTGECSLLTGCIPTAGVSSIQKTIGHDMRFTIGNQLMSRNYFSAAYHNGTKGYYHRDKTHKNLGYATWMAMGNGMEKGVKNTWPQSDKEMMDFTIPKYIDQQPFSIYYMTISGHAYYTRSGNVMARRNWDTAKKWGVNEPLTGYFSTQIELDKAMGVLLKQLEEAGIANDTVIVLSTDHYPYGLANGEVWGTNANYLHDLYGVKGTITEQVRDKSALIIWSGCIENLEEKIYVNKPVSSIDVLPTLLNLFGCDYDSRLFAGTDAFSDSEGLVTWITHNWLTDKGVYNSSSGKFKANAGVEVTDEYISAVKSRVSKQFALSKAVFGGTDFYKSVMKYCTMPEPDAEQGENPGAEAPNGAAA